MVAHRSAAMYRAVGVAALCLMAAGVAGCSGPTQTKATATSSATATDGSASARSGDPNCHDLKPSSVTGGGKSPIVYMYKDGSTTITRIIPAAGFDPTHASDSALIRNGYPPRPTDPSRIALWRQLIKAKIVGPGICVDSTIRSGRP
jgi:hypothetical protein